MTDVLDDMIDLIARIDEGYDEPEDFDQSTIHILVTRAIAEIKKLRRENRDSKIDIEDLKEEKWL